MVILFVGKQRFPMDSNKRSCTISPFHGESNPPSHVVLMCPMKSTTCIYICIIYTFIYTYVYKCIQIGYINGKNKSSIKISRHTESILPNCYSLSLAVVGRQMVNQIVNWLFHEIHPNPSNRQLDQAVVTFKNKPSHSSKF